MGFKKCMESFARTETKQKEFKKLLQSAGFSMPDGWRDDGDVACRCSVTV